MATVSALALPTMAPGPPETLIPELAPARGSARAGTDVAAVRDWQGRAQAPVEQAQHSVVLREHPLAALRVLREAVVRRERPKAAPRVRQAGRRASC